MAFSVKFSTSTLTVKSNVESVITVPEAVIWLKSCELETSYCTALLPENPAGGVHLVQIITAEDVGSPEATPCKKGALQPYRNGMFFRRNNCGSEGFLTSKWLSM